MLSIFFHNWRNDKRRNHFLVMMHDELSFTACLNRIKVLIGKHFPITLRRIYVHIQNTLIPMWKLHYTDAHLKEVFWKFFILILMICKLFALEICCLSLRHSLLFDTFNTTQDGSFRGSFLKSVTHILQ